MLSHCLFHSPFHILRLKLLSNPPLAPLSELHIPVLKAICIVGILLPIFVLFSIVAAILANLKWVAMFKIFKKTLGGSGITPRALETGSVLRAAFTDTICTDGICWDNTGDGQYLILPWYQSIAPTMGPVVRYLSFVSYLAIPSLWVALWCVCFHVLP